MKSFATRTLSESSPTPEGQSPWEILKQLRLPCSYLEFLLEGKPEGQKRHRQVTRTLAIDPHSQHKRQLKNHVGIQIRPQLSNLGMDCKNADGYVFSGPLWIDAIFIFEPPASFSKKKRAEAINKIFYSNKPDKDNAEKLIYDAMSGVVYKDDCKIVGSTGLKMYGSEDMTLIRVYPLNEEELLKIKSPHC